MATAVNAQTSDYPGVDFHQLLIDLIEHYGRLDHVDDKGYVHVIDPKETLDMLAVQLRGLAGGDVGETWNYRTLRNILSKKTKPGEAMRDAMITLSAMADGVPRVIAESEEVVVYGKRGNVRPNSIVKGESVKCAYPPCPIWFVPDHPSRDYHDDECRLANRRLKYKLSKERFNNG